MICFPNAKINLGLNIVEKREDGFHNIETVFYPIGWFDALEAIENKRYRKGNEKISLGLTGIKAGGPRNNLVCRAYRMLDEKYKLPPVKAHLHKNIPVGAGLGGGSSDAAFFINLLDEKFELNINYKEKLRLTTSLGSDCAFFLENKPILATGRGDVFSDTRVDLKKHFILVVYPAIHSTTAEAYKGVKPQKPVNSIKEVIAGPLKGWKNKLENDFEKNIFYRFPELHNVKSKFYEKGAAYAAMSGSGSAVYGIFEKEPDAKEFGFPVNYLTWSGALS